MVVGQLGGEGHAPVNQSAGHPKGIRRVSEGYPKGLTGRYGGSAMPGLGWRRRGAGENGGEWIGRSRQSFTCRTMRKTIFEPRHHSSFLLLPSHAVSLLEGALWTARLPCGMVVAARSGFMTMPPNRRRIDAERSQRI